MPCQNGKINLDLYFLSHTRTEQGVSLMVSRSEFVKLLEQCGLENFEKKNQIFFACIL